MKVFLPDKNRTLEFPDDATEYEITEYVNTYMPEPKPDWTMGKAFMGGVADTLNRNAAVRAMDTAEIENIQEKTQSGAIPPENIWNQRQLTDMERAALLRQSQGSPETMASLMDYRAVREQGLRNAAAYVDPGEYKQPESVGGQIVHDVIRNSPYSLGSGAQSGLLTAALGPMGALLGGLTSASDEGRGEQAEAYEELIRRGLSHEEALEKVKTLGLQNLGFLTATNSLENMLTFGGSKLFPKASALQKILGAVGGNFVLEGGEEIGQKLMSDAALGDKSNLKDLGYEGLIGGLSGALMGGGGSAVSAYVNRNAQREATQRAALETALKLSEDPNTEARVSSDGEKLHPSAIIKWNSEGNFYSLTTSFPSDKGYLKSQKEKSLSLENGPQAPAPAQAPHTSNVSTSSPEGNANLRYGKSDSTANISPQGKNVNVNVNFKTIYDREAAPDMDRAAFDAMIGQASDAGG